MFPQAISLDARVEIALRQNPHLLGRVLRFENRQGRITLHGIVGSYYQKQVAQEALRRVEGIQTIENHLEVTWN